MRNRASLIFEHALKSAYWRVLFILSPKSGPRSDFLPNVVPFGLFLLSAVTYSKKPFYLCTSNPPKGVARSFKDFPPSSLRSRLSSWARRARIRNTRGIENGILLNRDTNTIEALAALHIPCPHTMHTESRNKSTEDIEPHPSRYDKKGPVGIGTRITRALPACNCTKGPRNWNTDYRDRYPHRHTQVTGARKDATTRVRRAKEVVIFGPD